MFRNLLPIASVLLLSSCMTTGLPNYGRVGCMRSGRDKAGEIGAKAGTVTARTSGTPSAADVGIAILAGTASAAA